MWLACSSLTIDSHSIPDWNQVRHLCHVSEGRAGGDYKTGEGQRTDVRDRFAHLLIQGETLCQSYACLPYLLFHSSLDQRAKDFQDRTRESFRFEMCHSRDRGRWRTCLALC